MSHSEPFNLLRIAVMLGIFVVFFPLLPLIITGHWDWWEARVYAAIYILGFGISRTLAGRRHPDLLGERARFLRHGDTKAWDKILAPLVSLGGCLIPLVVGLDARYGWSPPFQLPEKLVALFIILGGFLLGSYALIENRFFSGTVRIQHDRRHQIVTTGPYRWVRHTGYAGALLSYLATPVFLDSYWAYLPVLFLTVCLVLRTALEDRTLQNELAGYREYAGQTCYRLIPGIW
ncbi:MAG: methyltransferase family protein [Fidelibacterota bacterium]